MSLTFSHLGRIWNVQASLIRFILPLSIQEESGNWKQARLLLFKSVMRVVQCHERGRSEKLA